MALALASRFAALVCIIALNKNLVQGTRLEFETDIDGEDGEEYRERVRMLLLSMMARYGNKALIPIMK